jgi:hypothetical protein
MSVTYAVCRLEPHIIEAVPIMFKACCWLLAARFQTARALGLTLPPSILALADEVMCK